MATPTQRDRLRYDLGVTEAELPDQEADLIFSWAEADFPNNTQASGIGARIIVIDRLLIQASRLTDYKQNQSEEKSSQVFAHLKDLRKMYTDMLEDLLLGSQSVVMYGALTRYTQRYVQLPDDGNLTDECYVDVSRERKWI